MNNTVNVEKIGEMVIDGKCIGNDIRGNSITLFKVQSDFTYNHMMIDDINQPSFYGADRCLWEAGFDNCTFEQKTLIYDNFHSHFSGVSFTGDRYKYLYTEKVIDMYMNDGEIRIICIPDICFIGMITMFNGPIDKIPAGWHICDGTEGTPNLIDKFIKATDGATGDSTDEESMDYPFEINSGNVPLAPHTHEATASSTADSTADTTTQNGEISTQLMDEMITSITRAATDTIDANVVLTLDPHTHDVLQTNANVPKRVETGDGEGAQSQHFAGVGSIYKGAEQWDWKTGLGNNARSVNYVSTDLIRDAYVTGKGVATIALDPILEYIKEPILEYVKNNMDIDVDTEVSVGGVTGGGTGGEGDATSRVLTIKEPRYYKLIFIMYIG